MRLILLLIVVWILWKKTKIFDGVKEKKKAKKAEQEAAAKAAEQLKKENAEKEKIANCKHNYEPLIYNGYKDKLFREIDHEGHSLEKCSECGNIITGELIAKVNCDLIPDSIESPIVYTYKGNILQAGTYRITFEEIHYLVANKNWPALGICKGDVCVSLYIKGAGASKSDDYPVGCELSEDLVFTDENDNLILIPGDSLCLHSVDVKRAYDLALDKYHEQIHRLSYDQRNELISEEVHSRSVLLKVPARKCTLTALSHFPELEEGNEAQETV